MQEVFRILKRNGKVTINVCHGTVFRTGFHDGCTCEWLPFGVDHATFVYVLSHYTIGNQTYQHQAECSF